MLRFRTCLAAALACFSAFAVYAQTPNANTPVTASHLQMSGVPIASGLAVITPISSGGVALAIVGADGVFNSPAAQTTTAGVPAGFAAAITAGALPSGFTVPDQNTAASVIPNTPIYYQVTYLRNGSGAVPAASYSYRIAPGSGGITGSAAFALDAYQPPQTVTVQPAGLAAFTVAAGFPAHCTGAGFAYLFNTSGQLTQAAVCVAGVYVPFNLTGGGTGSLTIGTVTTGAPGSQAQATITNGQLNLTLPAGTAGTNGTNGTNGAAGTPGTPGTNGTNGTNGAPGAAATVAVGTVTTGAAGSSASVTNSGTSSAAVLNFVIPQGAAGTNGGGSVGGTGTVSVAAGGGAGTSPGTFTAAGNNVSGVLTTTSGTATATAATYATVTFGTALSAAPLSCQLQPTNSGGAANYTTVYVSGLSTTGFAISTGATAPAPSTAMSWSYLCR